jgi:hypothetical protein
MAHITMRGAERPAKVQWSHPFLLPLQPLKHDAAQQTFIDIAEDHHNPEDINQVLSLTDNMPLAINLIAHLVDVEGCSSVLSRWEAERTSVISEGYDKKSNLDVSISLSLSTPRIKAVPQAKELLSLLSMLPYGLSDVELLQSKLPIEDIRNCRTTLIRTALAYLDDKKQLKALVPIREYIRKTHPPRNELVKPLSKYFHELLELHKDFSGTEMISATVEQISSNLANIQSLLRHGLQKDHPDLRDNVFSALYLNLFSRMTGPGSISLLGQLHKILPCLCDHRLEVYFITELIGSSIQVPLFNPETLVAQALKHFEDFDDPDLKCRPTFYTLHMKTDFCGFKVNSMSLLHTIIQKTVPLFLRPWIFVTWLYCWQLHLAIRKDIPNHLNALHEFTGSLVTICQPDYMHVRHRGWPGFRLIYTTKHVHSMWKRNAGQALETTNRANVSAIGHEIF